MANFGQLILTTLGLQEQIKAQSGDGLKFKRIAMGSGSFSGNASTLTSLVTEKVSVAITNGYIQNNAYTVEGLFSNEALQTGFEWREIGVFIEDAQGNEILYCYANAGDAYDYIPATEDERYSKYIRIAMVVGNTTNVTIVESEGYVYVDAQSFNAHRNDKDNPHGVTAEQIGAAPSGFGLGDAAKDISNKNLITEVIGKSGFYRGANVTNAPNQYWWCFVVSSGIDTTDIIAFGSNGVFKTARFSNSATSIEWKEFSLSSHTHTANSLGVPTLLTGTAIKDNEDLNDYTAAGNYYCGQSSTAGSLSNCPTYNAFTMKVYYANGGSYYIGQELIDYSTGVRYYRLYNASSKIWQPWYSDYSTANKPKPEDIGAGTLGGRVMANADASATLGNAQVRNILAGTSDLTAGTSTLATGSIYFVYE